MMSTEHDEMVFTEIVGDIEVPCDWGAQTIHAGDGPARWVAVLATCVCGRSGARLICASCKNIAMSTEECAICAQCGEVYQPFRRVLSRVEWLA